MIDHSNMHSLDELLHRCLRCGLCLPVCPTYNLTFQEQSSPRGRIRLIKEVREGSLGVTNGFADAIYFCLDCQACQTACPAGVHYGTLVENARQLINENKKDTFPLRMLKLLFLKGILASRARTKLFARLMTLYQRSGLREAVEETNFLSLFSERLQQKHALLPTFDGGSFDDGVPEFLSPPGQKRGRVAFLSGCIMNVAFADVHRDAVAVLLKNGFEIVIPKSQQCCGSLHGHNGDFETARNLARRNIDVFDRVTFDALVVDSAGCSAFMKEYGALLADDPRYGARAEILSGKVRDISEFLFEVGFEKPDPSEGLNSSRRLRVTYHDACHLVHSQKISQQPRSLIQAIPGIEFVELTESTWCCGSAGIYNVLRFDDSMHILERKMHNLAMTRADIVLAANPGCHLQLQYGIRKFGLKMKVLHPVSLLRRAYERDGMSGV